MAQVVIALGSNLGDRQQHLSRAKAFLSKLSISPVIASSVYETEPVGHASTQNYFNAVCSIQTDLDAISLLKNLKQFEQKYGRDPTAPRWSNRTIDLDIIDYDRQVFVQQHLHVPHPEYEIRLFVLVPLQELYPDWRDARSGRDIDSLIAAAPKIEVFKTVVNW